jgi:hypothetical protein
VRGDEEEELGGKMDEWRSGSGWCVVGGYICRFGYPFQMERRAHLQGFRQGTKMWKMLFKGLTMSA